MVLRGKQRRRRRGGGVAVAFGTPREGVRGGGGEAAPRGPGGVGMGHAGARGVVWGKEIKM